MEIQLHIYEKMNQQLTRTLAIIKAKKNHFLWQLIHFILPRYGRNVIDLFSLRFSSLKNFIRDCQHSFPRSLPEPNLSQPIEVSIIIPAYNQWKLTSACLNSILETCDNTINYELILADDCSTDETRAASDYYPGLIITRPQQNVGFLKNCNHAAKQARGRYLLLLNNDTIVLPNWLSNLYHTLEADSSIAIAGSKMLRPNGTIQEAGAILFPDGSIQQVGKGSHRKTPIFNIPRETDYVSGCSILIRKSFWDTVGGFDERYQQAYCEDCDLAMTARACGMRVVYQPQSEIIHYRRKSYFANHNELKKNNIKLFVEKWSGHLEEL